MGLNVQHTVDVRCEVSGASLEKSSARSEGELLAFIWTAKVRWTQVGRATQGRGQEGWLQGHEAAVGV